jgi:aerobic-type carbon monoxide dehydrogenase small subunit (CoxS/CutS family)
VPEMMSFELNGRRVSVEAASNRTLLDLLRVELGVTSVKRGCEQGECGACTVLLDGRPVNSCMVLAERVNWRRVTTIEGLEGEPLMAALRDAFMEEGAVQCGFCTPGMLISSYALLAENPRPTEEEVKTAIEGNVCRCTGYVKIIEAVLDAAERIAPE